MHKLDVLLSILCHELTIDISPRLFYETSILDDLHEKLLRAAAMV